MFCCDCGMPDFPGECARTGTFDRHFRTEALSEVGDLACRCPPNLYRDLHKHLTAAVIEIDSWCFMPFSRPNFA
jgi:hypothetical protein